MARIVLDRNEYRDKVYACWMGKNIGGTLGAPDECKKYTHNLTYYDPIPTKNAPNDDLDLQLIWLVMLEREGLPPRLPHFAKYWQKYLHRYPWNEYGFCNRNLARGLMPPVSGWFENYYVDEMGSPIRSEIWACLSPADPQTAASLAWMDSAMDHAGGEGTYGEMLWAAIESAAFVVEDPIELIRIGLDMIPPACSISRVIREALWCWEHRIRYDDARERITRIYWNDQPCNALPNHGFVILGWLYGSDFGDKLCKAVNCGFDTDCTGATLGSILGILGGMEAIPREWSDPIGTDIALHEYTVDCGVPKTLEELTDRTAVVAESFAKLECSGIAFGDSASLPENLMSLLHLNGKAYSALRQDIRCAAASDRKVDIWLHYNGDPVLRPNMPKRLSITCYQDGSEVQAAAMLEGPSEWSISQVADTDPPTFDIMAQTVDESEEISVSVDVQGDTHHASFTLLSPMEAQGYPNGVQSTDWIPGMRAICNSPLYPGISFEDRTAP